MMSLGRVGRQALAPAGGAASVSVMSFIWTGEQSSAKFSSRAVTRATEKVTRHLFCQQRVAFSANANSKVAATNAPLNKTATETTSKNPGGFVQWYEGHLNTRPVLTKMCTGSILWGVGDAVAQVMPQISPSNEEKRNGLEYDFIRTGRAVAFGFALHAPTSHLHFNFLEWLTNRVGVKGLGITVFKTIMEQFVYWSWISNSMYHGAMGAMQGMSPSQIYDRIADVLWDTQKAQWAFWIPVQLLNFRYIPVRHQLNVVLVTSIVWTALLSFWYPPEKEKEEPLATNMVSEAVQPHPHSS